MDRRAGRCSNLEKSSLVEYLITTLKVSHATYRKLESPSVLPAVSTRDLMSPNLSDIVRSLVETAGRTDGDSNFLYVACETLRVVIRYSTNEDFSRLEHVPALLSMLIKTAASQIWLSDGSELQGGGELRASFFGVLQVTIQQQHHCFHLSLDEEEYVMYVLLHPQVSRHLGLQELSNRHEQQLHETACQILNSSLQ
ncbi:hypothetical protein POM88_052748 [Heracleum sosnowskyi]|uniref:Uncharacterized protein n=1 Tax=Heracleum sosnowskyi TaxID=360622 RepID=A0AAD8GQ10_9APIA|nr:hypothetical protein POM88_052748 [Heracleum sosnowskyi]